jgi:hypothetical protein
MERSAQAPADDLSTAARIAGGEPPNADGSPGQILGIEAVQVALRAARDSADTSWLKSFDELAS